MPVPWIGTRNETRTCSGASFAHGDIGRGLYRQPMESHHMYNRFALKPGTWLMAFDCLNKLIIIPKSKVLSEKL